MSTTLELENRNENRAEIREKLTFEKLEKWICTGDYSSRRRL